jgi:cytochrome c oxidase subunit IV
MSDQSNTSEPSTASYFMIYAAIVVLIVLQVIVSCANVGPAAVYANLLIAGAQACLLAYFFMHLKGADHLTWLIAGAGVFWIIILFLFLLCDYVTRYKAAY